LEKQTATLHGIEQHLATLNGKVARHQETIYEKDRGILDRLGKLEGWQIKVIAAASVVTGILVFVVDKLISILL